MNRRALFGLAVTCAASVSLSGATAQSVPPAPEHLANTLRDDVGFERLLEEAWVLRNLIAMQQGDIVRSIQEFNALQQKVREQRGAIIELLSSDPAKAKLPDNVLASAEKVVPILDAFGVRSGSELANQLVRTYLEFSTVLAAASLLSWCDSYPFSVLCLA